MDYILQNTDVFDEELGAKADAAINKDEDSFVQEQPYKLTVSFHVNLLSDPRFEDFYVPVPSKTNKGTREDKIADVLSFQLEKVIEVLQEYGIDVYSTTIQGEFLEVENVIKIEIIEDTSEPHYIGRGKNKERMKI